MAKLEHEVAASERGALVDQLVAKLAERNAEVAARDVLLAQREAQLAERTAKLESLQAAHVRLWEQYAQLKLELDLVKRRLFVASAERVDTASLQLEFDELTAKLNVLSGLLPETSDDDDDDEKPSRTKPKSKPKGRRDLSDASIPEVNVDFEDPLFEQLVAEGKAESIGTETSYKLAYQRGGYRKLVIERVKYKATNSRGGVEFETAPLPPEMIPRCIAAPSALAHIAHEKFANGMPLYRQEERYELDGVPISRGQMSRWLEQIGGTFGATLIAAMRADMLANAFCIMTDATGFWIQPGPREGGPRRPCRKGHYFVQIGDRDHILFEYTAKHTTESVRALFQGFEGYVQADAASVYDALFRPNDDEADDGCTRVEVACWSHSRRKYWEAALAKERVACEALVRIGKIFEVDADIQKGRPPPSKIKTLRQKHLAPLVDEFLAFAAAAYERVKDKRSSLRSALGYTVRQQEALRAFLNDGRLRLDNNLSESALRKVVRIRDAALFAGSDDHAESAGHLLSLIASARLHGLDSELYLREMILVVPQWPRERYLELTPKYWAATRERLDPNELDAHIGFVTVPEPIAPHAPE